ncbi:MAG: HIT domain-containing protein [Acidobacteria bacterium]|nr:MAG: HIT domain-containing protein [Acidobacteriota bacterium]
MDHLWTPWRYHFITSAEKSDRCIFCAFQEEDRDEHNLILTRGSHSFVILNRFPYTSGHLMVVARRHIPSLSDAQPGELEELILTARDFQLALETLYRPDGFNIGFNLGKSAGAGVAGHLHLHVVPRWQGDSNFVGVIGQTRTIPEDLKTTYARLREYLSQHPFPSRDAASGPSPAR